MVDLGVSDSLGPGSGSEIVFNGPGCLLHKCHSYVQVEGLDRSVGSGNGETPS